MPEIKLIVDEYLTLKGKNNLKTKEISKDGTNPWDAAHHFREENNLDAYVEPEINQELYEIESYGRLLFKTDQPQFLKTWPIPPNIKNKFVWHLMDDYSQLISAAQMVKDKIKNSKPIKIAHIDTGFQQGHPALPKNLRLGVSFVKGEENDGAIDRTKNSFAEQDGHGTATMSILAGKTIKFVGNDIEYSGFFGGIPFAEIIPIRISDTVALIRSQNFVKAVEYAIQEECEVISMSMAGAPTNEWAKIVNKAYEAGITIVTAAGNSWNKGGKKLLPKRVLYPARWDRVIAVTGVTSNHLPYVFDAQILNKSEGGETMQGNFGPKKAMKNAIAAYTPNTPWATMNEADNGIYYRFDGGGTSTATPQIAAAAALWLSYYREEIEISLKNNPNDKWKKVESVKYALYNSADKTTYSQWKKYYGQGILKAKNALSIFPDFQNLKKAKKSRATLNGILDLLGILLRIKAVEISDSESEKKEMFSTEILQKLHNLPELHNYLDINDDENAIWTDAEKKEIVRILTESESTSLELKTYLKNQYI